MHSVVTHSAACTVAGDYASGLSSGTKKSGVGKRGRERGRMCFNITTWPAYSVSAGTVKGVAVRVRASLGALDEQGREHLFS